MPNLKVFAFSNLESTGLNEIETIFEPAKTYCFLGSSGVGKTTLLNNLAGEDIYSTKAISEKTKERDGGTTLKYRFPHASRK